MARQFYACSMINLWESMVCKVGGSKTGLTIEGPSKGCILVYDTVEDLLKDWPEVSLEDILVFKENPCQDQTTSCTESPSS